jgi:hypothetical protein
LLVKTDDITRSTVQKAVVVLASKPIFGPIRLAGTPTGLYTLRSSQLPRRDKLGVVTRAFFNQRDFSETDILVQFYERLEASLRTQLTESGLYMGMCVPLLKETKITFNSGTSLYAAKLTH